MGGDIDLVVIWGAPVAGAALAVGFEYLLRGPATTAGALAARGTLGPSDRRGR